MANKTLNPGRRNLLIGFLLVLVVTAASVLGFWLNSRSASQNNQATPETPSLSPVSDGGGASTPAAPWKPSVDAAWEAGDPNQVAEGIRQVLMDASLSPQDAASKVANSTTANLSWSISTSDLTAFHGIKITGATTGETSEDTSSVTFQGESATGEKGSLFTVVLNQEVDFDDEDGGGAPKGVGNTYYAAYVNLGSLLDETPGPLPISAQSDQEALDASKAGANFLVDPATHKLTPEQKADGLRRYFRDPQFASQVGPVTSEGREMTTGKAESATWITPRGQAPEAYISGAWVDPLNSNSVGGWTYAVSFTRGDEGKIVPQDVIDPSLVSDEGGE